MSLIAQAANNNNYHCLSPEPEPKPNITTLDTIGQIVGLAGSLVLPHRYLLFPDISRAIELLDKLQRTGEVPPQKLQALQRVLQSEFCNAVREVSLVSR